MVLDVVIWPSCTLRMLKECQSGSIVRPIGFHCTGAFAITCDVKGSDRRALVFLEKSGPEFQTTSRPEEVKVIDYDSEAMLQVDQSGPFEGRPQNMYEANGCLILSANGWRMNVRRSTGYRYESAQYDLTSKVLEGISDNLAIGTFGKWQLVLVNSDRPCDPPIEVGAFDWSARGEENT